MFNVYILHLRTFEDLSLKAWALPVRLCMWSSLVPVYVLLSIAHSNVAQVFLNLIIFAHWKHLVVKNLFFNGICAN